MTCKSGTRAKGADARHQSGEKLANRSGGAAGQERNRARRLGGARNIAAVLREFLKRCLALTLCLLPGFACRLVAQDRDFLTPNEVDQIREAQDPSQRLALYVHFAAERIDLLKQYLAKPKPGRSLFIHNTLEDYKNIIEAIDTVSDDALRRHVPIDKGTVQVLAGEQTFLDALQKLKSAQQPDYERYRFVLDEAIATTSDSHELAMEDGQKRGTELTTQDAKEKKDREAAMPTAEVKERKKAQDASEDQKKKVPSLYRPGEKPPPSQQP